MKILILFAVLGTFIFVSCDSADGPDGGNNLTDVIMPLKVGNRWIMNLLEFDSAGTVLTNEIDTAEIVGQVTINGSTWALFKNFSDDTVSIQNRADGLYWSYEGKDRHVYLYPTKPGDRFFSRNDTLEDPPRVATNVIDVETINSSVTVPAGTFSSIKYTGHLEERDLNTGYVWTAPYTDVTYIAPNKGIVQTTEYYRTSSGFQYESRRRSLISISLK